MADILRPMAIKLLVNFAPDPWGACWTIMLEKSETVSALYDEWDWAARISHVTSRSQRAFARRPGYSVQWLCTPNPALEGQTPLQAVSTESGFAAIEDMLTKIEQGIYT